MIFKLQEILLQNVQIQNLHKLNWMVSQDVWVWSEVKLWMWEVLIILYVLVSCSDLTLANW